MKDEQNNVFTSMDIQRKLKNEHDGIMPKATPMTEDKLKIRELEQRIKRIEMEKDILKKATALLMSDSLNNARQFMN